MKCVELDFMIALKLSLLPVSGSMWLLIKNNCLSDNPFEGILKATSSRGGGKECLGRGVYVPCRGEFILFEFLLRNEAVELVQETDLVELMMGICAVSSGNDGTEQQRPVKDGGLEPRRGTGSGLNIFVVQSLVFGYLERALVSIYKNIFTLVLVCGVISVGGTVFPLLPQNH